MKWRHFQRLQKQQQQQQAADAPSTGAGQRQVEDCCGADEVDSGVDCGALPAGGKDELQERAQQLCHDARQRMLSDGGAATQELLHAREELSAGIAALESERLEDIHLDRFHSTPGRSSVR